MGLDDFHGIIRVRGADPSDAGTFSSWIVRELPVPASLASALPALLVVLIAQETLTAVVAELLNGDSSKPVILAFGISGFLGEACALDYLASPYPHLELHLLDRVRGGQPSFLGYDDIARANRNGGLTLFPLMWLQRTNDPAEPETRTLLTLCQQTFLRVHRGYRLTRILKETPAERADAYISGGFRERCRLPVGTPLRIPGRNLERARVVFEVTKSEIDATLPGSAVSHLFTYRPPRCGFTRAEKQVLCRATEGFTDAQIALQLDIKASAVALRWRSIYARVTKRLPSALEDDASGTGHRGQEKRRRVIAFVNDHPEEMRPYLEPG
jgi:hypothetical protein